MVTQRNTKFHVCKAGRRFVCFSGQGSWKVGTNLLYRSELARYELS